MSARILVVDDDSINRKILKSLIELRGHRVDLAIDGFRALAIANVENYSLILLDISMPDMDGIEVATILRETGLKIPIIAVTAASNLKSQCLEAGMNGFIDKPIDVVKLDEILNKWCS